MTDDEFGVRLKALRSAVSKVVDLLHEFGDDHWSTSSADVEQRWERHDPDAFDRTSMAFGGMGSFNDVVIHPMNGHAVRSDRIVAVNEQLDELRSVIGREARELRRAVR